MKLGIMQPYFMPYLGYFQLMAAVDIYVIFDDVNYIKRGWSSRNYILVNGQKHLFNISVKGGSQNNLYSQVIVDDDFEKLRRTMFYCYKKAPFYLETMALLDEVWGYNDRRFGYFMKNSYELVLDYLGIDKKILLSSELKNDKSLKSQDKILDICKYFEADEYYNAIGGLMLYDANAFLREGIKLRFLEPILTGYPQFCTEFIPGLSMIDVLMMNSTKSIKCMLNSYKLVLK